MNIPADVTQWRKIKRAELLSRRLATTLDEQQHWNKAITKLLGSGFPILQQMTVGFCWPYKNEFDARFVVRLLHEQGARIALPEILEKTAPMQFREWWPEVATKPGILGLPVPSDTAILIPDALLIPLLGFGEQGDRLGYGGGFFDRTLVAAMPQPLKIGVGFELSRIPTTYPQPHDILMDFIITEIGIHAVENRAMRITAPIESAALSRQIASARSLPQAQKSAKSV